MTPGLAELCGDDALGKEHAGIVLEVTVLAVRDEKGGEAVADRCRVEQLVGDAEALRQGDRLSEEAGLAVIPGDVRGGRADHQAAGAAIERLPARRLELGPEGVRAHRQRHEGRALADGEPGDAGQAMARALVVRRREAVDADDLRAAGGEVVAERAADCTEADDDHVRGDDVHGGDCPWAALPSPHEVIDFPPPHGHLDRRLALPARRRLRQQSRSSRSDGRAGAERAPARLDQPRQSDPRPARPASGEAVGVSVDLSRRLADELGVGLVLLTFDAAAKWSRRSRAGRPTSASSRSTRCAATTSASLRRTS